MNITAEVFLKMFSEKTQNDCCISTKDNKNISFINFYKYEDGVTSTEFTEYMNKNLISNIVQQLCGNVSHEYYRIDTTGWVSKEIDDLKELTGKHKLNYHCWDLKISVEHENDQKDWLDEVVKLAHIRCPLKIVIGYNFCDKRENECEELLNQVALPILKQVDAFSSNEPDDFLIIFGNMKHNGISYKSADYRGYLYNYQFKKFERI